jgi:hypothetical protein
MGANVTVLGVNSGMGGLKESLTKFRKHHEEVGDALMNVSGVGTVTGDAMDKDEVRPPYVHAEWPRMYFHADGRQEVAATPADGEAFEARGFRKAPYLKPQIAVLDPATEKKALMDTNAQLQAQITRQNEVAARQQEQIDQLLAAGKRK